MGKASRKRAQRINPGHQRRTTTPANPLSGMARSSCSACAGPIEWMPPALAAENGAPIAEAVEQLGEDLDVWHCTSKPCGEWGFIQRQWEA